MVSISKGNSKMGLIPSVSLPSVTTCRPDAPCFKECYARRFECRRPNVKKAYEGNYETYKTNPEYYWCQVEDAIRVSRFFRFHVAGDIPDKEYLKSLLKVSRRNRNTDIVCFTKRYDIVNEYLNDSENGIREIPKNLHIIFSVWRNFECQNPYNFPEAHIKYKDNTTTATKRIVYCLGNCTMCAKHNTGCWNLKRGQQLVLPQH